MAVFLIGRDARHDREGDNRLPDDGADADPSKYPPANGADYPRSPFGQALRQVAQLTTANVGLEVAFADIGGWDTHVNQGAAQGQHDFSRSIAALISDLGDRLEDTVVLTMSEFGRAVSETAIAAPITVMGTR